MTTLLWTGVQLETSMGTAGFASMVAALLGLSQGAMLLLSGLSLLGDGAPYYDDLCLGFSGVLFGMKAVMMSAWPDDFLLLAGTMVIPAKYAVWAELFLTQALIPDTSFVGHLGGILAGHVYFWLKDSRLISCGARAMALPVRFAQKLMRSVLLPPKDHTAGGRRVGCCASAARGCWICSSFTEYNSLATDVCERCSTMREDCAFPWGQHHQASCDRELSVGGCTDLMRDGETIATTTMLKGSSV